MTDPEPDFSGWRRVRVVFLTALFLAHGAASFNADLTLLPGVTPGMAAVFVFGPSASPFVGLFGPAIGFDADPAWYCLALGLPLLGAIAAHPVRPSWPTGLVSAAGLVLWFLLGLSFIHQASG